MAGKSSLKRKTPLRPDPKALLAWYDRHRRDLPWRAKPGARPDPYRVWLSEIMLQQTTVAGAAAYFRRFLELWPDLAALARAPLDDLLAAWAGLGYYARARNLHRAARILWEERGGHFPREEVEWRRLPGIGAYTAAAIAAIAFDRPANVVDGNVERVMARLHRVETPLPAAKSILRRLAGEIAPAQRPGDYAQALMDLGAVLCRPRRPSCSLCPWAESCAAHRAGDPETYPRRAAKRARPQRFGAAFILLAPGIGAGGKSVPSLALRRRPEKGLLGGMMDVPGSEWGERPLDRKAAFAAAPVLAKADWQPLDGRVLHVFTHFSLILDLYGARLAKRPQGAALRDWVWAPLDRLDDFALPGLTRKILALALPQLGFREFSRRR